MKKEFYKKSCSSQQNRQHVLSETCFRTVFREFAPIFFPRNGIPSIFLLCGTVRNGIPRVFCSADWFTGSDWNSESLLLFLFHGTEFREFFSSAERFGTEFREFSVPRNSWHSAGTNQLFRLFRLLRNNFFVGNCQP
jgi:hypothetical protein